MMNPEKVSVDSVLFRSERYKALGGVCAGIALSRGISILLTRLIALFLLSTGVGLLLYLVFWIILPRASSVGVTEPSVLPHDSLHRSSKNKVLAGVCGGLAEYFRIDPSLVRIIYVVLVLCIGIGVLPYLYAWIAIPLHSDKFT